MQRIFISSSWVAPLLPRLLLPSASISVSCVAGKSLFGKVDVELDVLDSTPEAAIDDFSQRYFLILIFESCSGILHGELQSKLASLL